MKRGVRIQGVRKCTLVYVKNHWILNVLIKCVLLSFISYDAKDMKLLLPRLLGIIEVITHQVENPKGKVV